MYEYNHSILDKVRWLLFGIFTLFAGLATASFMVPLEDTHVSASSQATTEFAAVRTYDSPNAVSNGLSRVTDKTSAAMVSTEQAFNRSGRAMRHIVSQSGAGVVNGVQATAGFIGGSVSGTAKFIGSGIGATASFVGSGVGNTASFIGSGVSHTASFTTQAVSSSVTFIVGIPAAIVGFAADAPVVSAVTKPAENTQLQTITPGLTTIAVQAALPAAEKVSQVAPVVKSLDTVPEWPMRGEITTFFGVPHWPYQDTHTGMDISDGKPSGVTPVKPIKPGRVTNTVSSYSGLGNHVVVDHGDGMTSLYGHLASIQVEIGQSIDKSTTLGFAGSTGASTGTHLHLEIRLNGQLVDPLKHINGRP